MRNPVAWLVVLGAVAFGCSSSEKKEPNKQAPPASSSSASSAAPSSETAATSEPAKPASNGGAREFPFNPFAKVSAGDSLCMFVKARYEGKTPKDALPATSVWCWSAAEADADKATIAFETKPAIAELPAGTRVWSKKDAPKPEDFLNAGSDEIKDWKIEDEKKTIGDKEFDCKKLSVTINADTVVVWISQEVAVNGLVAMTRKSDLGAGCTEVLEYELAGFKSAEPQASWGKTAEEAEKSLSGQ